MMVPSAAPCLHPGLPWLRGRFFRPERRLRQNSSCSQAIALAKKVTLFFLFGSVRKPRLHRHRCAVIRHGQHAHAHWGLQDLNILDHARLHGVIIVDCSKQRTCGSLLGF